MDNKVELSLDKKFYDRNYIDKGIEDYKDIATFQIEDYKDKIRLIIIPKDKEGLEIVGLEFSNYVIGLMKNDKVL